ncbi:hypothetical protein A7982_12018 [Minicystis rosea]|nr:hypothetical protein A7982_12018 [Minicystis rosea]
MHGTRSEKLVEKSHWAALHLDRGHATLVVRRTLHNGGSRHDQATMFLNLPEDAVAVDLRTLSEKDGKPIWYRGDLMEAEAAAEKYRELTGIGGYYPKDPALLSWRHHGLLALQVFPVPPSQPKTVEYTLELPTKYRGGRHHVILPKLGTERLRAQVEVVPQSASDRVFIDDRAVPAKTSLVLAKDQTDFSLAHRAPAMLEGALASVGAGPSRVLSHFRIDAAPHLSEAPRGAHVVVIIDGSRSFPDHERRTGIAAVRAMLPHLPDARVEVITFDREVKPRLGGFVPASRAVNELEKLAVVPRNGSRIDEALGRADALLRALPARTPKRIVVITDLLTRSSLTPEHVTPLLKSGALLHVGVMRWGEPGIERNDEHPWSEVARATGGLLWNAAGSISSDDAKIMSKVYEEWARPVRIHGLHVKARGIDDNAFSFPATLDEGEGLEDLRLGTTDVTDVTLTGEMWASPVRFSVAPDDGEARLWSALAFGSDEMLSSLSEPEMMVLAKRGHAVTPVTSLLAVEPGVRPSTEGLGLTGIGEGGGGRAEGIGLGSIGTIGHGGGFDFEAYLRGELTRGLKACGGAGRKASMVLESTITEIVDVPRVTVEGAGNTAIERCVREAMWNIDLPPSFKAPFMSFTIST